MPHRHWREKFKDKVIVTATCRIWIGLLDKDGYGVFGNRRPWCHSFAETGETAVHRIAWVIAFGPIPSGLWVLHHCDTPPCLNTEHLFLGDNALNSIDRERKGRGNPIRGEQCKQSPLTGNDVLHIRDMWDRREANQIQLSRLFGITQSCISEIVRRVSWKHLP